MDLFETLHTCCGHVEDVHVDYYLEILYIYAPVTIVRGHYDLPLFVRLSVCLPVRLSVSLFVMLYGIEFV